MSWTDIMNDGATTTEKVEFAKLPEGTTRMRFLDDEPFSMWQHWLNDHRMSVRCPGRDCPICETIKRDKENGVTPRYNNSSRHVVRIWNYETNREEILAQGRNFFKQVGAFMKELGSLTEYDIKVIRSGKDRNTSYTILPMPPAPFEFKDKVVDVDFEKIFPLHDRETLLRVMDMGKDAFNKEDEFPDSDPVGAVDVPF